MRDETRGSETLALLVTRACQLDCVYCRFERNLPHMPQELLRRCADLLLEARSPEVTMVFLGGEPLLRLPQVLAAADYALERRAREFPAKRLSLTLTTNGLLLDDTALDALLARGVSIQLSHDGSLQGAQRPPLAPRPGAEEALERVLERLLRRGVSFALHTVVSPEGVERLRPDALAWLERGVPRVHFQYRVGAVWTRERGHAYVRELARLALEARTRGFALDTKELIDSNEPAIVSRSATVDVDGFAYMGCAVPAMELVLPRLKDCNRLGDARTETLEELMAAAAGVERRAERLYADDPKLERIMRSNLEMGAICREAEAVMRRRLAGEVSA